MPDRRDASTRDRLRCLAPFTETTQPSSASTRMAVGERVRTEPPADARRLRGPDGLDAQAERVEPAGIPRLGFPIASGQRPRGRVEDAGGRAFEDVRLAVGEPEFRLEHRRRAGRRHGEHRDRHALLHPDLDLRRQGKRRQERQGDEPDQPVVQRDRRHVVPMEWMRTAAARRPAPPASILASVVPCRMTAPCRTTASSGMRSPPRSRHAATR